MSLILKLATTTYKNMSKPVNKFLIKVIQNRESLSDKKNNMRTFFEMIGYTTWGIESYINHIFIEGKYQDTKCKDKK